MITVIDRLSHTCVFQQLVNKMLCKGSFGKLKMDDTLEPDRQAFDVLLELRSKIGNRPLLAGRVPHKRVDGLSVVVEKTTVHRPLPPLRLGGFFPSNASTVSTLRRGMCGKRIVLAAISRFGS